MIREPFAAGLTCYTKPLSKARLWIQTSQVSNEQEQFVEAEQPH